jgi:tRNA-2-methylthio-N6-dimethylallyladenosine synthase
MNKQDKPLKVTIKTFGCQMNEYDTQVAEGLLEQAGFEIIGDINPRHLIPNASIVAREVFGEPLVDVVLLNTCSVREHAEDRVFGRLGQLGKAKRTNPDLIVGLMGCMVEEHKEKLFKRFPQLDLMVGTRNIKELPVLIEEVRKSRRQVSQIKQDGISIEYTDQIKRQGTYHAWLPIMTGCDKVCTYCIVPVTRGAEVSMPAREVYRETSRLVSEGVKWITLLGQNVNSYQGQGVNFPELLEMLCEIEGLKRICFTTSHPHDATEELFQVIARNPKISRRFHLPLQSGSNRILKRMKRLHTYEEYKAKINRLRELVPDISITTDIIAGFSGETDEDHKETLKALSEIKYDGAYIFKYSLRAQTPAAKLTDDVPMEVKEKRNGELLMLQRNISEENNQAWLGREIAAFAESVSTRDPKNIIARMDQEKNVVFEGNETTLGRYVKVRLTAVRHETFLGELVNA